MPYDDNTLYAKYLKGKITSGCGCGGECDECKSSSEKCSCCPPGLVAIYDVNGNQQGCLTPNDAEEYVNATIQCPQGTVKLYKEGGTPVFRGCVSESEYVALYNALNPS
jgi:hypothetical protein